MTIGHLLLIIFLGTPYLWWSYYSVIDIWSKWNTTKYLEDGTMPWIALHSILLIAAIICGIISVWDKPLF